MSSSYVLYLFYSLLYLMELTNIIKGHWNEVIGNNRDLSESRLIICYSCPLYSPRLGGVCNNKLWLNPNTGDVSTEPKDGYRRGCGCRLLPKTTLPNAVCPLGKW